MLLATGAKQVDREQGAAVKIKTGVGAGIGLSTASNPARRVVRDKAMRQFVAIFNSWLMRRFAERRTICISQIDDCIKSIKFPLFLNKFTPRGIEPIAIA